MAEKVSPGTPLGQLPTMRAAFINDLVDLLTWAKLNGFGGRPSAGPEFSTPTDVVKVRNLVGGDLALGDVVQLGDELLDNKDKRYPWFEGNAVASPADRRWAILMGPVKTGEIGMAIVSGVCLASVTVGDVDDTHAAPSAAASSLTSASSGPIEILSPIESTGAQLLWVRLGSGGGSCASGESECPETIACRTIEDFPAYDPETDGPVTPQYALINVSGCWKKIEVGECSS